jgi:hypothetical protein
MSISSIAEESTLRLTPTRVSMPGAATLAATAAATAADAVAGGETKENAIQQGKQAAQDAQGASTPVSAASGPLTQLVKYIPTETITLYVAVQAALGDLVAPNGRSISDANFASRWEWMWVTLAVTLVLTTGLSYRSQKNSNRDAQFKLPYFDVLAAGVAFLVWALSLPSTPLRDIAGYNYSAWNSVIILGGTIAVATTAYVLGKTVSWQKVVAN